MNKHILVIEDDPDICELLTVFLSIEGYNVTGLSSAQAALRLLNQRAFNLITLDMNLPDMDGNEFLSQLAKRGSAIPVVVVSAYPRKLEPNPLVKRVIHKPFDLAHLMRTVRQLVEAQPRHQLEQEQRQESLR